MNSTAGIDQVVNVAASHLKVVRWNPTIAAQFSHLAPPSWPLLLLKRDVN